MHHGGAFCYSPNVSYLRGDVMYFDNQHVEKLRMVDLREMTRMLGYTGQLQYFYQVPGRDLNYGLIELKQDEDILGMVKWVYDTNRIIDVYVVERPEMVLNVYKPQPVVREESLRNESNVEVPIVEQNMWEDFQPFEEKYQISEPFEEGYQISEQDYDSGSHESSELEEFKDSDYDFSEDDRLFDANVDRNVEWVGLMKGRRKETTSEHEHNTAGDEMNSDELISLDGSSSSDEDSRPKENTRFHQFNSKADMVDPQFKVGMIFGTSKIFKDAVREHAIKTCKAIKFVKNDSIRVRAICRPAYTPKEEKKSPCGWTLQAFKMQGLPSFQLRTYEPEHNCSRVFYNKHVTSTWLSHKYLETLKSNPTIPV